MSRPHRSWAVHEPPLRDAGVAQFREFDPIPAAAAAITPNRIAIETVQMSSCFRKLMMAGNAWMKPKIRAPAAASANRARIT